MSVAARGWLGFFGLAVVMCAVLFGIAGTMRYVPAWIYLGIFFAASLLITLYLMKNDPALLERRVDAGPWAETRPVERAIMWLASLGFIATLAVPALDRRLHWTSLPVVWIVVGDLLTLLAFLLIFLVYRENSFTSGTIQVMADQRVIDTGPYAFVRHPMYAAGALLFIGTPLALGSVWGLAAFAVTLPALLWRLFDEESLLSKTLPGYESYLARVRWRLIPGVF